MLIIRLTSALVYAKITSGPLPREMVLVKPAELPEVENGSFSMRNAKLTVLPGALKGGGEGGGGGGSATMFRL